MKIIKILPRRGRIYEVRFDDGTYINLDRSYAEPFCLKEGMDISEEKAGVMEDESDLIRCKNRALFYLSSCDLSEKKLKEKLIKAGFEPRFVNLTANRLKELSYIDDQSYAYRLYERCKENGLSARQTVEKLVSNGINRDIAKEIVVCTCEDEKSQIRRLLSTKYKDKLFDEASLKRTTAALIRRGFRFCDVRAALCEYTNTLMDINEE